MIKVVPDANVVISGMLGVPGCTRKLINFALAKKILLYGSSETYKEFCEKITLNQFQKYLVPQLFTPEKIMLDYRFFINMADSDGILKGTVLVKRDPDDDEYIKVAKASGSKIIVTRDKDLLDLKTFEDIRIVTPENFIDSLYRLQEGKLS